MSTTNGPIDSTCPLDSSLDATDESQHVDSPYRVLREEGVCVYADYEVDNLPQHPGREWTRFVCISDTHGHKCFVPPGDVLLHAGDLSHGGLTNDMKVILNWLSELPHSMKMYRVIAGNHDYALDETSFPYFASRSGWSEEEIQEEMNSTHALLQSYATGPSGITYLQDSLHECTPIEEGPSWSVFGSPWTPAFSGTAFKYSKAKASEILDRFEEADILMTHGPPFGILDLTAKGKHAGCPFLLQKLEHLRPKLHIFGHIHEARGAEIHKWKSTANLEKEERTVFVNPSALPIGPNAVKENGRYKKAGSEGWRPIIVDMHRDFR